jgi:hypothetical protein
MEGRVIEADLLYNVFWKGKHAILHGEFQSWHDKHMGRRMWEYNSLASCISGRPVCSIVIYLHEDVSIVEPPHIERLPNGDVNHVFFSKSIKLWEVPTEAIKKTGIIGMLPLTKDGARQEVVEEMIASLKAAQRKDLLVTAFEFASLVLTDTASQNWLKERIKVLDEILKNSWAYKYFQDMAKEDVKEQVTAKVTEQVKNESEIKTLQRTLVRLVEIRFPELASVAQFQAQHTFNKQTLNDSLDALMSTDQVDDAQRILRDMSKIID